MPEETDRRVEEDTSVSPTSSSPVNTSKKRRTEDAPPTILPFSGPVPSDLEADRPETAVSEPIIRGAQETKDLQVQLFQLRIETKRVLDELRKRVPDFEDNTELPAQEKLASSPPVRPSDGMPTGASVDASVGPSVGPFPAPTGVPSEMVEELHATNSHLSSENEHLRDQIQKLLAADKTGTSQLQAQIDSLLQTVAEKDGELQRLRDAESFYMRTLQAEKSRSNLLHDAKESLQHDLKRLRSGQPIADDLSAKKLEEVLNEKQQLEEMLVDERKATAELQQSFDDLYDASSAREEELKNTMKTLNTNLVDVRAQRDEALTDQRRLQTEKDGANESLNNLKLHNTQLEQRLAQQLAEQQDLKSAIETKDRRLAERSRQVAEKQERITALTTEIEGRDRDIQALSLQLKHLNTAYETAQAELTEARETIENREARLKKAKSDLKDKKRDADTLTEELRTIKDTARQLEARNSQLETDLEASRRATEDIKRQYESSIDDLTRTHSFELDEQSKKSKARIAELQSTVSHNLVAIADLKRANLEAENRAQQIASEHETSHMDNETFSKRISTLETSLRRKEAELLELNVKLDRATEAAKAHSYELQDKRQIEAALTEKVHRLEKTVADQSVQLNNASSVNVAELRQQAEKYTSTINELAVVRREYSANVAEWYTYHENAERSLHELSETKKRLEAEIAQLRATEQEREARFRESIKAGHESQLKYLHDEYTYNYNSLRTAYDSISQDLATARSEKDSALQAVKAGDASLAQAEVELTKLKASATELEGRIAELNKQLDLSHAERDRLSGEISEARNSLSASSNTMQSTQNEISRLQTQLDDKASEISAQKFKIEDLERESVKLQNHYRTLSLHANNLMSYAWYEISNLQFVKSVYASVYPRLDLVPGLPARQTPLQALRTRFLMVLATVKFKRAAKTGLKRQCYLSQVYFREQFSD